MIQFLLKYVWKLIWMNLGSRDSNALCRIHWHPCQSICTWWPHESKHPRSQLLLRWLQLTYQSSLLSAQRQFQYIWLRKQSKITNNSRANLQYHYQCQKYLCLTIQQNPSPLRTHPSPRYPHRPQRHRHSKCKNQIFREIRRKRTNPPKFSLVRADLKELFFLKKTKQKF